MVIGFSRHSAILKTGPGGEMGALSPLLFVLFVITHHQLAPASAALNFSAAAPNQIHSMFQR